MKEKTLGKTYRLAFVHDGDQGIYANNAARRDKARAKKRSRKQVRQYGRAEVTANVAEAIEDSHIAAMDAIAADILRAQEEFLYSEWELFEADKQREEAFADYPDWDDVDYRFGHDYGQYDDDY